MTHASDCVRPLQVSRPYKQAEFEIIFGQGVSKLVSEIIRGLNLLLVSVDSPLTGIDSRPVSWTALNQWRSWQGRAPGTATKI